MIRPIPLWENQEPPMGSKTGDMPTIVPYIVSTVERTAAIVVCPGGGYSHRADHEGEPVALWLNSLGISAFVLNYRVAPNRHPAPFLDVQRAIRSIRYHADTFHIDGSRVGVLGFSAGGHLASTIGTQYGTEYTVERDLIGQLSDRPDLLVLCYPVISFTKPWRHTKSGENLLGAAPSVDSCRRLSNELWVTQGTPPTFLWHTADDSSVPVEHSLAFAQALSRNHVPFELHVYETGRHGLGLAREHEYSGAWTDACARWLRNSGFCQ